ncbi:type IV pilus assembly protein PilM [Microcella alkaliphila]|uniref:Cell division protein FtsA n=1 Tax=Microcella alkaliphila TaxID=279828 RepID=A0A0U5BMF2_9MICO|nr:type IV pilus assembly protein PilM [Microcella alkaliphila]BAU31350.1 cell division protein FtsA [Microcella alkaliphila]
MGNQFVAVDIGQTAIRAVEARVARGKAPEIRAVHEEALPDGAVRSGEVVEPTTVASALKKMWSAAKFKSRDVVLGMGDQKVVARDLVMPKASRKEVIGLLPLRVQELIPMPVAEAVLDFYPIAETAPTDEGPMVRGLLIAAYNDAVTNNVQAIRRAGLNTLAVDFVPFALHRSIGNKGQGVCAVVDIGAATTNVLVSRDGIPDFVRIIPAGSDDVTRALANQLEIPRDQAEELKIAQGLHPEIVPPNDAKSAGIIVEVTRELMTSIINTLRYYSSTHDGVRVDSLVLTGNGARLRGLPATLAHSTGISLVAPEPFADVKMPKSLTGLGVSDALRFSTAFGLTMGGAA